MRRKLKAGGFRLNVSYYFLFFLAWVILLMNDSAYAQDKITINHADSLIGKTVNGEQVREAIGNVSLTHNDVKITCGRVIQYFNDNKADLYVNVHVVKDTMTINAPQGTYYGNESKVICPSGVTLNDTKTTLRANYGIYYFNEDLADFKGDVKITDNKYVITSDKLKYYRSVSKSYANGNVKIVTDSTTIYTDDLVYEKLIGISTANGNVRIESDSTIINSDKATYNEFEKKSIAENNVKINFTNKNAIIYGDYSENYEKRNYSFIKGNARLVEIEKKDSKEDTLFINSNTMESFRNKPEYYIARDSVKIIRSDFLSSSQVGYYFRDISGNGGVVAISKDPAVWKESMQVTGDSIYATFKDVIQDIYVNHSAFAMQYNNDYPDRFDQVSGIFMYIKFNDNELDYIRVDTNAASIYFVYDNKNPNGANKSNGEIITLRFKEKQVTKVKIFGKPKGTFFPENLVDIPALKLLGFRIRNDKPRRLN
jgi:lipopolysaccharide export system protein LptA